MISVMSKETGPDGPTHRVRRARAADLRHLAGVEESGGGQFAELFGDEIEPILLSPAVSGAARDAQPGFLLVAVDEPEPPVGFAHVLEIDGDAHLEQLSVRPEHQGNGIGTALVRASMAEAARLGHRRMSLCTYLDVPWNGPFYARLGFREVTELAPYEQRLRDHERLLRLDVNGPRGVMDIPL
jgi:GNAT superfamily N-acetyltransferase